MKSEAFENLRHEVEALNERCEEIDKHLETISKMRKHPETCYILSIYGQERPDYLSAMKVPNINTILDVMEASLRRERSAILSRMTAIGKAFPDAT